MQFDIVCFAGFAFRAHQATWKVSVVHSERVCCFLPDDIHMIKTVKLYCSGSVIVHIHTPFCTFCLYLQHHRAFGGIDSLSHTHIYIYTYLHRPQ